MRNIWAHMYNPCRGMTRFNLVLRNADIAAFRNQFFLFFGEQYKYSWFQIRSKDLRYTFASVPIHISGGRGITLYYLRWTNQCEWEHFIGYNYAPLLVREHNLAPMNIKFLPVGRGVAHLTSDKVTYSSSRGERTGGGRERGQK